MHKPWPDIWATYEGKYIICRQSQLGKHGLYMAEGNRQSYSVDQSRHPGVQAGEKKESKAKKACNAVPPTKLQATDLIIKIQPYTLLVLGNLVIVRD